MKTARSNTRPRNTTLHLSNSSSPVAKVPSKKSTTASRLKKTRGQNNDGEIVFLLKNQIFHFDDVREKTKRGTFTSLTTQHLRSRRDAMTENLQTEYTQEDLSMCKDSIINIKYDEDYKVWNNFSIFYKNKVYDYTEYRVLNDAIKICNSTDDYVRNTWKLRNKWVKERMYLKSCNEPNNKFWFYKKYYAVHKHFTVYLSPSSQYFTRDEYGVLSTNSRFITCKEKLRPITTEYTQEDLLMCNDSIINIKYDNEYKVWNNFSIFYKKKVYDYTEYRVLNDGIKICNSTDDFVRNIWKVRNKYVKERMYQNSCSDPNNSSWFYKKYYAVDKHFTVYLSSHGQYFTKNNYGVNDGEFEVCDEMLRPTTAQYTQIDLSMCNDSIINIKYDDEYKVWNNFSIFYKNKMYDYTEYRVLNDSIKICNSIDAYVRKIWKLRNKWVKETIHQNSCNEPNNRFWFYKKYYAVDKHFTVYLSTRSQYFTRNDYGVTSTNSRFITCKEKLRPITTEYTQEDLLMCNDSIINIKYDNEYKVWNNFSIFYKKKVYDYTEYRVLNDGIKICNSTDADIRHIWKVRNKWVKATRHYKTCNKPNKLSEFYKNYYAVDKQFTVHLPTQGQHFTSNNYGVRDSKFTICTEKLGPISTEYTQEDLSICNDSIINIKYDNEYKVWKNFSIFYKNKVYDDTEYRVLNDGIKICNSTDVDIRHIWKVRNKWVKATRHYKTCNKPNKLSEFYKNYYAVDKQFTVFLSTRGQHFTRNGYGVRDGRYKVWNNLSVLYENKVYDYTEYRVLNDGIKICNSADADITKIWKLLNDGIKERKHFNSCNEPNNSTLLHRKYYRLSKQLTVYSGGDSQYFTRNDHALKDVNLIICTEKLGPITTEYTQEDLLMCNDSIINIKYGNEYKVWNNFSIFYKNKVYDYTEYRVLNDGIKICNSTAVGIRYIWKVRNKWVKATMHYKTCNKPITYTEFHGQQFTVLKDFGVRIQKTDHVIQKYDYGVFEGKLKICNEKLFSYTANIKIIIAPLCALAISFISLLLLLIVYCMLPELRTLPGLNLMSLSFAFLLWQTYLVVFLSVYSRVGSLLTTPCATLFVTTKFLTYSILMNAAVNIYHLRKTFCGNTLVKSDVNKWRRFLRYSLFSWGIPVVVTIVYIVLINTGAVRFEQYTAFVKKDGLEFDEGIVFGREGAKNDDVGIYQHISGDCINGRISPEWSADVDVFGLQGCLLLCIVVMFIFTAYRIRQKLKASSSIAQKSNIRQNHKFLILFKLSTTTALSYWLPLFISRLVDLNFDVKIALYTVTLLTGAYIGFAFAFTRRNYTLLKKKYSPAKHKSVSNIAPAEV